MAPWQKRLADLAHLLLQCHHNYMEPEQFRRSINQFLQTARTVTFIIQKNKDSIPEYDEWYANNVLEPWKNDELMKWAKDARNTIEKEGDLDLYSTISLKLFFGYLEETDLNLEMSDPQLLHAGVKKLVRIAQKKLPSGVSHSAAIKVSRRWVADSLPNYELLGVICIVYRKIYEMCSSLALQANAEMDQKTPDPSDFDEIAQETRQTRYFKLSSLGSFSMKTKRKSIRRDDLSDEIIAEIEKNRVPLKANRSIDGIQEWLSSMAEITFDRDGYHVPMAFLYSAAWVPIDMISFQPNDTTDKYIIWRDLGDRVRAKSAHAISFIGEAWIRQATNLRDHPISSQPIIGEQLQVVTLDRTGNYRETRWDIIRNNNKPSLSRIDIQDLSHDQLPTFLAPVMSAFGLSELRANSVEG